MSLDLEIREQKITLFPERCAYWHEAKTLILSDIHWGKSETLQKAGLPMPSGYLAEELAILSRLVQQTHAERVLFLGDLLHGREALTADVMQEVGSWRASDAMSRVKMVLLRGNHDRRLKLPENWRIESVDRDIADGPFIFRHEPDANKNQGNKHLSWAGHIHPVITIKSRWDRIRTPCFVVGRDAVLLPAFGLTTGGYAVQPKKGEQVYAVTPERVIQIQA